MYTGSDDPSSVDMEKECSPQMWSKDPNILKTHFAITVEESKRVRMKYSDSKFNVPYGSSRMESYDIYFKGEETGKPIFVYVHGGYWQKVTKEVSAFCVAPLVERGYKVIIVDYNLCPSTILPTVVEQLREGMGRILNYAHNSSAPEVSICGHSAGAHLVSCILDTDYKHKKLVKHFILISGPYDLSEIWNSKACSSISGVENPLGLTEETVKVYSPMFYNRFAEYLADFHLLTGHYEAPSFQGQAKAFRKVLEKHGFRVHRYTFPSYDHFDIVHSIKDEESDITRYLLRALGLNFVHKL